MKTQTETKPIPSYILAAMSTPEGRKRLTTAAPDLLAALEGVLLAMHETDAGRCGSLKANTGRDFNEHMDFARAAIAKSKGE